MRLARTSVNPAVLVLAVSVLAGVVYGVALAVATPLNDWDELSSPRDARGVRKKQRRRVHRKPGRTATECKPTQREIGELSTMCSSLATISYLGLVQLFAYGALVWGVAGMSGRIGLRTREAVFGALTVATFACPTSSRRLADSMTSWSARSFSRRRTSRREQGAAR